MQRREKKNTTKLVMNQILLSRVPSTSQSIIIQSPLINNCDCSKKNLLFESDWCMYTIILYARVLFAILTWKTIVIVAHNRISAELVTSSARVGVKSGNCSW